MVSVHRKMIDLGLAIAESKIYHEGKIWSRYSNDKVDIGEVLAMAIRALSKALPLSRKLRALSIGSSAEPQFRLLETAFRGGLFLIDVDNNALDIVRERIRRQHTSHVTVIRDDYTGLFQNRRSTGAFLKAALGGKRTELITLHHSLYYCQENAWGPIFENLYRDILASRGAIHAVLMSAESGDSFTTTWLYNHFVGRFFGCLNDQNLRAFKEVLRKNALFKNARIHARTHRVRFFVDDFEKFMAVIWMILLYPDVHQYSQRQKEEIVEFVYKKFWLKKAPLVQLQDHLILSRGIECKELLSAFFREPRLVRRG